MTLAQVIVVCVCAIMMLPYSMSLLIEWSDRCDLKRAKPVGEIPAKYRPVDWEEFEEAVQAHLEAADDPLDPIDDSLVDQLLWRAERGMKLITCKERDKLDKLDSVDKYNMVLEQARERDYADWEQMYREGYTVEQIATDLGFPAALVRDHLDAHYQSQGKIVAYNTSTEKIYTQDRIGGWST